MLTVWPEHFGGSTSSRVYFEKGCTMSRSDIQRLYATKKIRGDLVLSLQTRQIRRR